MTGTPYVLTWLPSMLFFPCAWRTRLLLGRRPEAAHIGNFARPHAVIKAAGQAHACAEPWLLLRCLLCAARAPFAAPAQHARPSYNPLVDGLHLNHLRSFMMQHTPGGC